MTPNDIAPWISMLKDAFTGLAAVAAALIAGSGLKTWKRQLVGNANYEVARRLARSTYQLREAIRYVRAPFITVGEESSALRAAGLDEATSRSDRGQSDQLVYNARWQKIVAARIEFEPAVLEAESLWGADVRNASDQLIKCTGELHYALQRWVSRHGTRPSPEGKERLLGVVSDAGEISEPFSNKVASAIKGIEDIIRPHLRS